jgi:hypothetical protein
VLLLPDPGAESGGFLPQFFRAIRRAEKYSYVHFPSPHTAARTAKPAIATIVEMDRAENTYTLWSASSANTGRTNGGGRMNITLTAKSSIPASNPVVRNGANLELILRSFARDQLPAPADHTDAQHDHDGQYRLKYFNNSGHIMTFLYGLLSVNKSAG